jgi:hypothetical protein
MKRFTVHLPVLVVHPAGLSKVVRFAEVWFVSDTLNPLPRIQPFPCAGLLIANCLQA